MTASRRVAVVGPTASGKSAVALQVAMEHGDLELISIDSMQVYRDMDIGTAKPSLAEQQAVKHHMIDIVEPSHNFTVAEFQQRYAATLADIVERGRRAILVGGTGLYHRAVIDGLNLPGEWPEQRARLEREARSIGTEVLHTRLGELDPAAADKMEPTNTRRVVRALEVIAGSGQRFSSFGPGLDSYPETEITQIGLRWNRTVLAQRIESRVQQMMTGGFLAEVQQLADRHILSRTAAQALGYRELLAHLGGQMSLDEATEQIIIRTRQFAVRQERWFRRDPRVQWIDITTDPVAEAAPAVTAAFERGQR